MNADDEPFADCMQRLIQLLDCRTVIEVEEPVHLGTVPAEPPR